MSQEETSYEELPDGPDRPSLPVGEILAAVYQHIWRYRWPYLGQLVFWTIVTWMSQFPVHIVSFLLGRARLFLPVGNVNVLPWLVEDAVRLLLLILSSAVIFLSCGTAILFGRRPRAGDGLQIPNIAKTFWLTIFLFWLAADLAARFAIHALSVNYVATQNSFPWLSPFTLEALYYAYPILIWALIGLALPIAAFESSAMPFQQAWRRLRNFQPGVLLLTAIVTAPVFVLQFVPNYARDSLVSMIILFDPGLTFPYYIFGTVLHWIEIFLTCLLILLLSASTLLVYGRTAPDTADLAKMFD